MIASSGVRCKHTACRARRASRTASSRAGRRPRPSSSPRYSSRARSSRCASAARHSGEPKRRRVGRRRPDVDPDGLVAALHRNL